MLRKVHNVQIGEWYREAGTDAFGQPRRRVWRVENTYTGVDGVVYATLTDNGAGATKTIATSALLDRSLYVLTDDR